HPNFPTILPFITSHPNISSQTLQHPLKHLLQLTFNQITLHGDTSTNHILLLISNASTNNNQIKKHTQHYYKFNQILLYIMTHLPKSIASHGQPP
ncbi:bifunctional ornithine acetyltransferase/N-acetylglutamate synthase, partial [Staphylococcus epidermidis]|uniref:bifunctional ornithine acetyltransferase/N-acetylglutamate synthase n=1 Tax=Staphylococcus epidermidis TaxID=1282 RepID=UPI0016428C52